MLSSLRRSYILKYLTNLHQHHHTLFNQLPPSQQNIFTIAPTHPPSSSSNNDNSCGRSTAAPGPGPLACSSSEGSSSQQNMFNSSINSTSSNGYSSSSASSSVSGSLGSDRSSPGVLPQRGRVSISESAFKKALRMSRKLVANRLEDALPL